MTTLDDIQLTRKKYGAKGSAALADVVTLPTGPQERQPRNLGRPFVWRDPRTIAPREWLYGRAYVRGVLSVLVAPGGTGKTSAAIAEAVAMATGKPILGEKIWEGGKPLRVLYWNGEDSEDELHRRLAAVVLQHRIEPADIGDRLSLVSGLEEGSRIKIAGPNPKGGGFVLDRDTLADIEETIRSGRYDVAVFDPFVSIHEVPENDNGAIDQIAKALALIANKTRCAIQLCHHARKAVDGAETSITDSRGASALIDACRIGRTLNFMSDREADEAGIEKERRFSFVKVGDGKANLSQRSAKPHWLNIVSVDIGNETETRPSDHVAAVVRWEKPSVFADVTEADVAAVIRELGERQRAGNPYRESPQSGDWAGRCVARVLRLDLDDPGDKAKAKTLLRTWIKSGALQVKDYPDSARKPRPCIVPGVPDDGGGF